jgi:hypothetical protein
MDARVKVFIGWSGELSRSVAQAVRGWLGRVVQHVDPWMSDEDIKSGERWNDKVSKALDGTEFGIICMTAENREESWLIFEAGALAKHLNTARVVPLCIDLKPAAIKGPLASFQGRELNKDGMRRIVVDLMAFRDPPMPEAECIEIFEPMWPSLEAAVIEAKQKAPASENAKRADTDMLEELVERVRRLDRKNGIPFRGKITVEGGSREATEEEQAAIERVRKVLPANAKIEYWADPPNPPPGSFDSNDV